MTSSLTAFKTLYTGHLFTLFSVVPFSYIHSPVPSLLPLHYLSPWHLPPSSILSNLCNYAVYCVSPLSDYKFHEGRQFCFVGCRTSCMLNKPFFTERKRLQSGHDSGWGGDGRQLLKGEETRQGGAGEGRGRKEQPWARA